MDGPNPLGEPVRGLPRLDDIRRSIVILAALSLTAAGLIWLAPHQPAGRSIFDAAPTTGGELSEAAGASPSSPATTNAQPPVKLERPGTVRSVTAKDITAYGGHGDAPLIRLPPRQPLSQPEPQPSKPKRQLLPRPIAIDGGHIAYRQGVITLPGVEALPLRERCDTDARPCGALARTALRRFLRGRSIACDVPFDFGKKRGEATTACSVGGEDIGAWVVENGWARAVPGGRYEQAETSAKAARRGIWQ
ncbi:thermonuclease family protein [Jiella sp. MQZ9-1]|uniref:Thermonuclease family protein n=1 Tax=Jiella flava TaxID=2816857 RepID=A0A939G2D6_9HYPH|nr:thermonuclease family protein [Jiella flava]MBO0663947.1 thermonuclease family protein [Jiella flava]MCD2472518.1 thermonuclease family protein [Jiella flava]